MKMKYYTVFVLMIVSRSLRGAYEFEIQKDSNSFSVIVTSSNLVLHFNDGGWVVLPDIDVVLFGSAIKRSQEYVENNESLMLTPNKRARIYQRDGSFSFTPVSFRNGQKGFRVFDQTSSNFVENDEWVFRVETNIQYVALSDTPVQVGEDDVEMILEKEGWVKYEKPKPAIADEGGGAAAPHPAKSGNSDGIPTVESDGGFQPSEPTDTIPPTTGNHCHVWLYVGISLCALCAVLYVIRRESKN